eukprot:scaffold16471_cov106-Skeletonema_dohrnii-CCMP3373.AAC.3
MPLSTRVGPSCSTIPPKCKRAGGTKGRRKIMDQFYEGGRGRPPNIEGRPERCGLVPPYGILFWEEDKTVEGTITCTSKKLEEEGTLLNPVYFFVFVQDAGLT